MITNITLENFKCFRMVEINPKLVTLFIGPNGTGKSGVLQALLLLKQSRGSDDMFPSRLSNRSPIHFLADESTLGPVQIGYRFSGYWLIRSGIFEGPVEFDIHIEDTYTPGALPKTWGSTRFKYAGQTIRALVGKDKSDVGIHTSAPVRTGPFERGYGLQVISSGALVDLTGRHDPREVWMAPTNLLGQLRFVPAARGLIRQVYSLGGRKLDDPYLEHALPSADEYGFADPGLIWPDREVEHDGITREEQAAGLGKQEQDAISTMAYSQRDLAEVSKWTKLVTGVGFRAENVPPRSVMPISEAPIGDVKLIGEGFGTNALIQLLFELARAVEGATVLMEEPEVHLHPKAQAELASVIVEEAKASNKQVIMTTHSEHIAGRLLTLVAERKLTPDEVAIYSFEKDEDTGVCSASEIEVTPRGQVTGGLKSFFETDREELRRYVNAMRTHE